MNGNGTTVVFHITEAQFVQSIDQNGVQPAYSRSAMKVNWYCSRRNIGWALNHVSMKHHVPVDTLVVCSVSPYWKDLRGTAWKGVYYSSVEQTVETFTPAELFIEVERSYGQDND